MEISIIALPLLASIISGFFGKLLVIEIQKLSQV